MLLQCLKNALVSQIPSINIVQAKYHFCHLSPFSHTHNVQTLTPHPSSHCTPLTSADFNCTICGSSLLHFYSYHKH